MSFLRREITITVVLVAVLAYANSTLALQPPPDKCPSALHLLHQEYPKDLIACAIFLPNNCFTLGENNFAICPARPGKDYHRCRSDTVRQVLLNFAGKPFVACAPLHHKCISADPPANTLYDCRVVPHVSRSVDELDDNEGEGQSLYADYADEHWSFWDRSILFVVNSWRLISFFNE